jgi:hypothetical protein
MTEPIEGRYKTAVSFRQALESRLLAEHDETGIALDRLRKLVAFERFLARMVASDTNFWALKGGYALELRIARARSTTDLDLTVQLDNQAVEGANVGLDIADLLQTIAAIDLSDHFNFRVGAAQAELANAPYGGTRFPVVASVAGRLFERIQVDVAVNEPTLGVDQVAGSNRLEFAGIAPVIVPTISQELHFAEKLHAYTVPRGSQNSRVKDFVDMVLFIERGNINRESLASAVGAVFRSRGTHVVPTDLPSPPVSWASQFEKMATECGIDGEITTAFITVSKYLAPVLTSQLTR